MILSIVFIGFPLFVMGAYTYVVTKAHWAKMHTCEVISLAEYKERIACEKRSDVSTKRS